MSKQTVESIMLPFNELRDKFINDFNELKEKSGLNNTQLILHPITSNCPQIGFSFDGSELEAILKS